MWKGFKKETKTKRLNQQEIRKQLFDSLINSNTVETKELNEQTEKINKLEDAAELIKWYEEILKTKREGIASIAYYQGKIFSRFREKEKFVKLVSDFGVHKRTIIFTINVFKLLDKYPKLESSFVTLSFIKSYFKDIKEICKESSKFKQAKIICLRLIL